MSGTRHGRRVRSKLSAGMIKANREDGCSVGLARNGRQRRKSSGPVAGKGRKPPRVLFVSHEASRTGAVIALLRQVRWLVDKDLVDPQFLIRSPGELFAQGILDEFAALGPTKLVSPTQERLRRALRNRLPSRVSHVVDVSFALRYWIEYRGVSVVWFNTVMNGPTHYDLSLLGAPRVCHIHELRRFLRAFLPSEWMTVALEDVDIWAAASDDVANMLTEDHRVDADDVFVLPGIAQLKGSAVAGSRLRSSQSQGASSDATAGPDRARFKVAAIGPPGTRKGSDVFVAVAVELARRGYRPRIEMTWLGGAEGTADFDDMTADVEAAGLSGMVSVEPSRPDPESLYDDLDLLLVPSRQESFPLVMLEAGSFGVPLVTFKGSGGSATFASMGAGVSVDYLDCHAMAEAVVALLEDPDELRRLGGAARHLVQERFNVDAIGARCQAILERALGSPPKSRRYRLRRVLGSKRPG